jgi:dihydroneopterin aldolase / 2-amino-4-hydroxy-6-hydroxymethyldihydropteridine diphosphokinase / dihydropteroate synthase
MIPNYIVPTLRQPVSVLLENLIVSQPTNGSALKKVIPFPKYPLAPDSVTSSGLPILVPPVPPTQTYWTFPLQGMVPHKTYIMATLNATPDSFSDGSRHNTLPEALKFAAASFASGADIIDIGGYSTRPHAEYVSPTDELERVVPIITGIRRLDGERKEDNVLLISVDTFRSDVAKAAVLAGANCINDVYAFTGPEYPLTESSSRHFADMRKMARELSVPVVLMHSRGEASAHKDYSEYKYAGRTKAVVEGVRVELGEKVNAAVKGRGGLRRWLIILDPGLGFSKTLEGNLEVLRYASEITSPISTFGSRNLLAGYPQLLGASKKSFLGLILAKPHGSYQGRSTDPQERGWATAAAVACSIHQGALAVRVHDVMEMGDVTRVATALWA